MPIRKHIKRKHKKTKTPTSSEVSSGNQWKFFGPVLAITSLVFLPIFNNGFTNWDDTQYITQNPLIADLSLNGLKAIFSTPVVSNYHPLTVISLALDYQISGVEAWSYQLTNVLLHVANTLLVFWLIYSLSEKKSWIAVLVALIFGIHPMHVESVAWASERKDVLYTLFYLSALIAYIQYLDKEKLRWIVFTTLLGGLSLLSKPAAIVLPLSLWLLDYFLKRKWSWKWILEKIPLLVLCAAAAYITLAIQSRKAMDMGALYNIGERLAIAGFGLIWYLVKFIFPHSLSALHPFPRELPWYYYGYAVLALAGILLILKTKDRLYHFGFGFYVVNLLLVIQLLTIGNASVAERYTYVPYIGISFLLCMKLNALVHQKWQKRRTILYGFTAIWLLMLSVSTWLRIPVWKNSESLWGDVLKIYPESAKAWTNKGLIYYDTKEWNKVVDHLTHALTYEPNNRDALEWRARTYIELNENEKALADAHRMYQLYPDKVDAKFLLASCYATTGQSEEALKLYNELIEQVPYIPDYINNRGTIYFNAFKKYEDAKKDFEKCIQLKPQDGLYYLNLSRCEYMLGYPEKAKENLIMARELGIQIDPSYAAIFGL